MLTAASKLIKKSHNKEKDHVTKKNNYVRWAFKKMPALCKCLYVQIWHITLTHQILQLGIGKTQEGESLGSSREGRGAQKRGAQSKELARSTKGI